MEKRNNSKIHRLQLLQAEGVRVEQLEQPPALAADPPPITAIRFIVLLVLGLPQWGQFSGLCACDIERRCSNGRLQSWH